MRRPGSPWRIVPLVVYFGIMGCLLLVSGRGFFPERGWVSVAQRKAWNCFVSWHGVVAMLLLTGACLFAGLRALRTMVSEMTKWGFLAFVSAMILVDLWLGVGLFQTSGFTHFMLRWQPHNYMHVMGANMLRSFVATTILFLTTSPWKLVPAAGLIRTTAAGVAMMGINYFFTFSAYVALQSYEIE